MAKVSVGGRSQKLLRRLGGDDGLGQLFLQLGCALSGPLKFGLPQVGGEGGGRGIGRVGERHLPDAFGLDGAVEVQLKLHEGIGTDPAGLSVVVAVDGPGLLLKG